MPTPVETVQDNRRAIVRASTAEVVKGLAATARLIGGDTIFLLVFTGIWVANVQHIPNDSGRFAGITDIPPDSQRRPVTEDELERLVGVPQPILGDYVERLIVSGLAERLPGGLVVPTAVFTRPDQIAGANEIYTRLLSMVSAMRAAGFQFGE